MDANGGAGGGIGYYGKDFYVFSIYEPAVATDGDLTPSAEIGETGAFGGYCIKRVRIVQEAERGYGGGVAETRLDAKRALPGGWAELIWFEALADPVGAFEAIEAGGGEENSADLTVCEFAEASIDVAAELYRFKIRAESFELCPAALAAGAAFGFLWQCGE